MGGSRTFTTLSSRLAAASVAGTLLRLDADTARGNRPSFSDAARPETAEPLYERFSRTLRELGVPVQTGVFGAKMLVSLSLVNDGPVTIILEV